MAQAIREAKKAAESDDIPIGCVIVHANRIIGRAHNQIELLKDATAHAEMIAITQAENYIGDWRLNDAVLFITKEPCPMCAGAILQSRIGTVFYGTPAPRDGAAGSAIRGCSSQPCHPDTSEYSSDGLLAAAAISSCRG